MSEQQRARQAVVLVGPPGSGKTTVAAALGERLGLAVADADAEVERRAGSSVSGIFLDSGEEAFRALEVDAVAGLLETHDGVLALGGGAVLDERTRRALGGRTVVWLDVSLHDAAERVGLARSRPVLALNPRGTLQVLLARRRPLYAEVATHRVDTSGRTVEEVVDAVARALDGDTSATVPVDGPAPRGAQVPAASLGLPGRRPDGGGPGA